MHIFPIGKNNNTRTVQAESSKFASVLFDQGFKYLFLQDGLELIGMPSDGILHRSDCCLLRQYSNIHSKVKGIFLI